MNSLDSPEHESAPERRMGRGPVRLDLVSVLVLTVAVVYGALGLFYVLYYFSLPSDGWTVSGFATSSDKPIVYNKNRLGVDSPLESGDILVSVDGVSVKDIFRSWTSLRSRPSAGWQAGRTVPYVVRRNGTLVSLDVPLYHRTVSLAGKIARDAWAELAIGIGIACIGVFVFARRPTHPVARAFLLFAVNQIVGLGIYTWFVGFPTLSELLDPVAGPLLILLLLAFYAISISFIIYLFLAFPEPKRWLRTHQRVSLAAIFGLPFAINVAAFVVSMPRPTAFGVNLSLAVSVLALAAPLIGGAALLHSFRSVREPFARAQLRWLAVAFACFAVANILGLVSVLLLGMNQLVRLLEAVLANAFPIGVAVAIFRYRLFDIDVIINRSMIYGPVTGALGGVIIVSSNLLQLAFGEVVGVTGGWVVLIFAVAIELLFSPLRRLVTEFVDRRFYREKYAASRALASFAEAANEDVDAASLRARIVAVAMEISQAPGSFLVHVGAAEEDTGGTPSSVARDDPLVREVADRKGVMEIGKLNAVSPTLARFRAVRVQLVVPLAARGDIIALLAIGPRPSGKGYSLDDRNLLKTLALQAGPPLRLAQLTGRA